MLTIRQSQKQALAEPRVQEFIHKTIEYVRAEYPAFAKAHKTTIDGLLLDGVHPNDLGHQLVAELLGPAVRRALQ